MSKSPPRVHFTHHGCLVAIPTGETVYTRRCRASPEAQDSEPEWTLCGYPQATWRSAKRRGGAGMLRFTTNRDEVTCLCCRSRAAVAERQREIDADERGGRGLTDDELVGAAWMQCCRHHGASSPFSANETVRIVGELATEDRLALLAKLEHLSTNAIPGAAETARKATAGDVWRRVVEHVAESCDEILREALRPAIAEYLVAADVVDHIGELLACATAKLLDVDRRARAGELEIVHGTLADAAALRSPRPASALREDRSVTTAHVTVLEPSNDDRRTSFS